MIHFGEWRPTTVLRVVRSGIRSSTRVVVVETDAGEAYLKAMGNPEGEHALARELLGTMLARRLGLSVLDFAVIDLSDLDEFQLDTTRKARPGPAFITRAERGSPLGGGDHAYILGRLDNVRDVSRLVVFDTWVLNCDRHDAPGVSAWKPRRDNVFASREEASEGNFVLKAIDHTHCFLGRPLDRRISQIENWQRSDVFGLFPEFVPLLDRPEVQRTCRDLIAAGRSEIAEFVGLIPKQWNIDIPGRKALVDLLVLRAEFVAQHIEDWLWPQMELPFSRSDEGAKS